MSEDPGPPADRLSLDFHGAYSYSVSGDVTDGDVQISGDAFGVQRVAGRATVGGANVSIDIQRVWILPLYVGGITVDDPAAGLNAVTTPVAFAEVRIAGAPATMTGSSTWYAWRGLLQLRRYSLNWSVIDGGRR